MRRAVTMLLLLAAVPLGAGAVVLRYRYRVGDEQKFREDLTASGGLAIASELGDQTIPVALTAVETRSLKVLSQAAPDEFWLESRSLSGEASISVQGDTQRQQTPGTNLKLRANSRGEILEMKEGAETQRGDMGLDLKLDSILKLSRLTGFPADDLAVGATWSREIPVQGKDGKTYTARVTSKLDSSDGVTAVVSSRYQVPIPPTEGTLNMMGMEIPVKVEGWSTGDVTERWDLGRGRSLGSKGKGKVEVKLYLMGSTEPAQGKFDIEQTTTPVTGQG
ncbi:MAG: hypothetical protein HYU66_06410 [Armatimonadetes bacterium]|nr:hypothetical protein [Armatimonadota bacterium]